MPCGRRCRSKSVGPMSVQTWGMSLTTSIPPGTTSVQTLGQGATTCNPCRTTSVQTCGRVDTTLSSCRTTSVQTLQNVCNDIVIPGTTSIQTLGQVATDCNPCRTTSITTWPCLYRRRRAWERRRNRHVHVDNDIVWCVNDVVPCLLGQAASQVAGFGSTGGGAP